MIDAIGRTVTRRVIASALLLFALHVRAQDQSAAEVINRSQVASIKCDALYIDEVSLAVLDGKIPVKAGDEITAAMHRLNRKPNATEAKAISKLLDIRRKCFQFYEEGIPGLSSKPFPMEQIALLERLRDGKTTFGGYALALQRAKDKLAEFVRNEFERLSKQEAEQNRVLSLSCIVESKDQTNGVEFQYVFNEAKNTVWASRGAAAPSDLSIGPTEISFKQKDATVSISRSTGRFSIVDHPLVISGTCQKITERRF